jgi:CBS domain-containing protein
VVGVLTDRDIVTAVVAQGLDPASLRVGEVMASDPVTVAEADSFIDLLRTMHRHGLRRLPVTNSSGVLVGLVTLDDALEIVSEQMHTLVQAIGSEQRRERERRR